MLFKKGIDLEVIRVLRLAKKMQDLGITQVTIHEDMAITYSKEKQGNSGMETGVVGKDGYFLVTDKGDGYESKK